MDWEMISAVGQMLGAIGVIISIVYLAAQIRNQNKESQRASMNVLTTHWSDLNRSLVEESRPGRALDSCSAILRRVGWRVEAKVRRASRALLANGGQSLSWCPGWNAR
jgi:heme/copper-type cytochrome/quinol oxidase subunit 1